MPVSVVAFSLRGYRGPDSCILFILSEVLLLTQVLDEETKALWLNPAEPGLQLRPSEGRAHWLPGEELAALRKRSGGKVLASSL